MMRSVFLLLLVGLSMSIAWSLPAFSQTSDVYRVEVAVANQSESERLAAAKAAMPDVLVKSTANPDIMLQPQVKLAVQDAGSYLSHFSYTSDNRLVLNFSPQAIRNLLQQGQSNSSVVAGPVTILNVVRVESFADLKQLQLLLKNQPNVRKADLVEVKGDRASFSLVLNSSVDTAKAGLTVGNKLNCSADTSIALECRWIR